MKVVINGAYGGFGLSDAAIKKYAELKGITLVSQVDKYGFTNYYHNSVDDDNYFSQHDIGRADPHLVATVEILGTKAASGRYAQLVVVEIPDDVEWQLCEYDGNEHIAEVHRTWS
jgi:hypothetical protein